MTNPEKAPAAARRWRALPQRGSKAYDLLVASPLILWFSIGSVGCFAYLHDRLGVLLVHPSATVCLQIFAKIAVLLFALLAVGMLFLRRAPKSGAQGLGSRIASLLGTYLSVGIVLLPPAPLPPLLLAVSAILVLAGGAFSCYAILYLGRSFSLMAEARELVTGGPYAFIRHPLYVGEGVSIIGATMQFMSPIAVALLVLQICCQLYRMHCEEAVLTGSFPDYAEYTSRTARVIPGVY
jgi:protein-S-isoprenylcysteine O-methyltransferase Ste14